MLRSYPHLLQSAANDGNHKIHFGENTLHSEFIMSSKVQRLQISPVKAQLPTNVTDFNQASNMDSFMRSTNAASHESLLPSKPLAKKCDPAAVSDQVKFRGVSHFFPQNLQIKS